MKRLVLVPYTFVLMNWAAIQGFLCFLRRDGHDRLWAARRPNLAGRPALGHSKP